MTCWRSECRTGCYYPEVCSEAKVGDLQACPSNWCGPWKDGVCIDCDKPRRLGDPPSVPIDFGGAA